MVIMDMENGDQVSKRGCLCPQDSRVRGGGMHGREQTVFSVALLI